MVGRRFGRDGAEFGRGLGFFDAIYGFAITLLVTNLDPPPAEAWASLETLLGHGLGPQFLGFVISFVVIAAFWRHNTVQLSRFASIDSGVITVNLVGSALIVLLPFTTQGISDPRISDYPLPVALYAMNVALAMLSQTVLVEVGRRRGLLLQPPTRAQSRAEWLDASVKIAVFLLSIPVAYLIGPNWAMATWILLLITSPITGRRLERLSAADAGNAVGAIDVPDAAGAVDDGNGGDSPAG